MASHSSGLLGHGHDLLVSQHTEHAPHPATDGDNGDGDGSALADLLRIIPFLFPKDVCKLSSMCKTVLAVADSDHVWAHKVPIYPAPDVAPAHLISEKKKIKKTYFHLRSDMPQVDISFIICMEHRHTQTDLLVWLSFIWMPLIPPSNILTVSFVFFFSFFVMCSNCGRILP